MKITASEIKQHEFEKSFRGYNIEDVDIFLNSLSNEWDRMTNENKMLRMQLEIAEKEASKLREVELTLIKTLQSAETTSNKITDQAKIQADKKIEDAGYEAERILAQSKSEAEQILQSAKSQAEQILVGAKMEVSDAIKNQEQSKALLKSEIINLETKKGEILDEFERISEILNSISVLKKTKITSDQIIQAEQKTPEQDLAPVDESPANYTTQTTEEEDEAIHSIASSANNITLEDESDKTNLEVIEGIGPKIKELLNNKGIINFRDMATTPVYKLREILEGGGSNFAMHDPSTWVEQALLAEEGRWAELEDLKDRLIAGKRPEAIAAQTAPAASVMPSEGESKNETQTEEMLDRVNKVKAAIRKSMLEKETLNDSLAANQKIETLNDKMARQREEESKGSFFDNL